MINEKKTIEEFGYSAEALSNGSNKHMWLVCDYCGSDHKATAKNRTKSNSICNKDACFNCRYKKREDISMARDGVKNAAQRKESREKISNHAKKWINSEEFKEKRKKSMLNRYGVENAMHSETLKEKQKNAVLSSTGYINPSQSPEVREKIKKTNLEKYGTEQFLSSDYAREKIKQTSIEKYGVDNVFRLEKNKIKGDRHHFKNKDKALENGRKSLETKKQKGTVKLYNGKTISEIRQEESSYSDSAFRALINKHGLDVAMSMQPNVSSLESIIRNFLDDNHIHYTINSSIGRYKPDIVIDDLVLELDGLYYHSDKICDDDNYHFNKKKFYTDSGYRSCFFREDELNNKLEIVKSIILNKLNLSKRIYARECSHSTVSPEFFSENHLMGQGSGKIYSLDNDGKTVAAMRLKRIDSDNYEISRFCTLLGVNVVGAFSKILKKFISDVKPRSITTFVDMRYGEGKYLERLNFKFCSCYKSFNWTDTNNTFHRMRFPGNSGYDQGLYKIWDCGQSKYILNCV